MDNPTASAAGGGALSNVYTNTRAAFPNGKAVSQYHQKVGGPTGSKLFLPDIGIAKSNQLEVTCRLKTVPQYRKHG